MNKARRAILLAIRDDLDVDVVELSKMSNVPELDLHLEKSIMTNEGILARTEFNGPILKYLSPFRFEPRKPRFRSFDPAARVYQYLEEEGPRTLPQIIAATGGDRPTIMKQLEEMLKDEEVVNTEGKWSLV